jgi:hypothetical protein
VAASVWPVTDRFVAEIGDVDLSRALSDADFRIVEDVANTLEQEGIRVQAVG